MSRHTHPAPASTPVSLADATPDSDRAPLNSHRPSLDSSHTPPRPTAPTPTSTAHPDAATSSRKVCAYVTRNDAELLVFEGPGHDGLQVPKGTVETDEPLRTALRREVHEESGLRPNAIPTALASDVWTRRHHPPRYYVRHFFHVSVDERRDAWTHTVTGSGEEAGSEFAYRWLDLDASADFALDLDDYVPLLRHLL